MALVPVDRRDTGVEPGHRSVVTGRRLGARSSSMPWIVACAVCAQRMIVPNEADPVQAHRIGDVKCSGSLQPGKSVGPVRYRP